MNPETAAAPAPHSPIDPTDVAAMILFVIWSVRRLDIRLTEQDHNPDVPPQAFEAWKRLALSAYSLSAYACLAKVAANVIWYYGARGHVHGPVLAMVGAAIFIAWVIAITIGWRRISNASRLAQRMGIRIRSRREQQATR